MTQAELEQVAREIRTRGLHSTWEELLAFSKDVVGNLADAYQALLRRPTPTDRASSADLNDVPTMIKDKMARALTLLTSEAQVARWGAEVAAENSTSGMHLDINVKQSDIERR
ncbi:hypothetical protein ACFLUK_02560 [Chloroflexota bacterium]